MFPSILDIVLTMDTVALGFMYVLETGLEKTTVVSDMEANYNSFSAFSD